MMKNKILLLVTLLFAATTGCDVIDQVPDSQISNSKFWLNTADAQAGLMAVYDQLQSLASVRLLELGDVRSDDANAGSVSALGDMNHNIFTPTDVRVDWSGFFIGIARANDVLAHVPGISFTNEADKNKIMGEAYFLRAYFYFLLVRNWGAVPIILTPYTKVGGEMLVSRDPEDQVYKQIVADLDEAEKLLPVEQSSSVDTRIRATRGAVQALYCNVLLERGYKSYAAADDFKNAAQKALEVMNNSLYGLVPISDYAKIFTPGLSKESIFEIPFDNTKKELNNLVSYFIPRAYTKSRSFGGDATLLPTELISEDYEAGDLRASVNIDSVPTPAGYFDEQYAGSVYVAKYPGTIATPGVLRYSDSHWIVYRLADVILMRAEALVKSSDVPGAISLLNQIRNRAGLPNTTATTADDVFKAIQKERLYELCFEGKRWYDLVRTGLVAEMLPGFNGKILLPVPQKDIDVDPNLLPQNNGY